MKNETTVTTSVPFKRQLFIKSLRPYDAVKLNCGTRHNLGALEQRFLGGGSPGTLNAKKGLIDLIKKAGGDFGALPGFVPARHGMLRRGAGSGYIGWKDFGSPAAARKYLEQYFVIVQCATNAPTCGSSRRGAPVEEAVKTDGASAALAALAGDAIGPNERSTRALERIGFLNLGEWKVLSETKLQDVGDDEEWTELKKVERALYAFCHGAEVLYIGKTSRSIEKRFVGYRDPGSTQATNKKCHREIRRLLVKDQTVRILVFPDAYKLQWDAFRISLAAGLEDALVVHFKPRLNGKGGKFVTATAEAEQLFQGRNG
jgi:hypothetical protein